MQHCSGEVLSGGRAPMMMYRAGFAQQVENVCGPLVLLESSKGRLEDANDKACRNNGEAIGSWANALKALVKLNLTFGQ